MVACCLPLLLLLVLLVLLLYLKTVCLLYLVPSYNEVNPRVSKFDVGGGVVPSAAAGNQDGSAMDAPLPTAALGPPPVSCFLCVECGGQGMSQQSKGRGSKRETQKQPASFCCHSSGWDERASSKQRLQDPQRPPESTWNAACVGSCEGECEDDAATLDTSHQASDIPPNKQRPGWSTSAYAKRSTSPSHL